MFCSKKCLYRSYIQHRECDVCGTPFQPKTKHPSYKYCSDTCRARAQRVTQAKLNVKKIDELSGLVEWVTDGYKEPLKPVKNGYGYVGTVTYSKDGEYIQCHICGRACKDLKPHVYYSHKKTSPEYKTEFGLAAKNGLIAPKLREKLINQYRKRIEYMTEEELEQYKSKRLEARKKRYYEGKILSKS